jgi:sulfhydrogenase subunit gamma (sulfur reductase)
MINAYLPQAAVIREKIVESPTIFTLRLEFDDENTSYQFKPGQFNMITMPGVGEIAISIVSDPEFEHYYDHTIRVVGRVTKAMRQLQTGDSVGIRGPFGQGWPMDSFAGRDVVVITGGIGCAPTVSAINYIFKRRQSYGKLSVLQGVKHSDDIFFEKRFARWRKIQDTQVLLAADVVGKSPYQWHQGFVTELLDKIHVDTNTSAILCGPEIMMKNAVKRLLEKGVAEEQCYITMERSMHCGIGHCGHCQLGPKFICKDGPVFSYPEIKTWLNRIGI